MFRRILITIAAAGCLSMPALAGKLGIGDAPPPITVKQWVKGDAVATFEKGNVYVVEFWATWCGPCKKSIPHVSELQKTYADKNVTVIGVSVWERDQSLVVPFVEKMGDKMAYRVAMDDVVGEGETAKGKMAEAWMKAAGQGGIPAAFVVDRAGRIAWIGHPMQMDAPLAQIVAGTYDIEAAKKVAALRGRYESALAAQDAKAVVAAIDEMIAADPSSEKQVAGPKFIFLLKDKRYDAAYAYGAKLVDGLLKDDPQQLNMLAWTIVDPEAEGMEKRDLPLALRAVTRANELTGGKEPAILDTLAKVQFDSGDVAKAIETQQRAVDFAKGSRLEAELQARLDEYKKSVGKGG